ncbi:MAG: undecaprenyl-diphosphate phosphatase [Deltaproteobacteria bacterium]|nr:MAG: undecaprenyl-diphosphate phosphatase [Deltaproteobacteria bacterium]
MNDTVSAAILGLVQGLTEFLPVSSSGHLVLFQRWLPVTGSHVAFDLALHLGTLLPVLLVYRDDFRLILQDIVAGEGAWRDRPGVRLLAFLAIGSLPTAAIGLLLQDWFEAAFSNPISVGVAFAVTGTVLYLTRFAPRGEVDLRTMNPTRALLVGLAQGIAITPGISRSGSTIAAGLFLGLRRDVAARYSFLLSIPAILGAFSLKVGELSTDQASLGPLVVGFAASAVSGYLALRVLLKLVDSGDFSRFCWYLWALSAVALGMALLG